MNWKTAHAIGETYYHGRKPCAVCGEVIRYVSSRTCVPCTARKAAEHRKRVIEQTEALRRRGL